MNSARNIVILDSINQTTKVQALSLISDCYKYQMDLTSNSSIVTEAIKYVNSKMDHLNATEKKLLQDIREDTEATEAEDKGLSENSEREEEQQQTHNGVF